MKKIILTMAVVLTATLANAQSNQKGTIHVNVMGGFLAGSATDKSDVAGSKEYKFSASGAQFGANFQYGIAESFSAGIGLEFGSAVLTPKDLNSYSSSYIFDDLTVSTFKIILSGRYYFLNKEKFNLFAGPSVGYTSAKDSTSALFGTGFADSSTKYSGLNFGLNAGGNYYFTDHVGVILNLGYEGNSLKSTTTSSNSLGQPNPDVTGKSSLGGIKVMAGLALKF